LAIDNVAMADDDGGDSCDINRFWHSDDAMLIDDAGLLPDVVNDDVMMMVDPRDIEGRSPDASDFVDPSELALPDGFDLLEFVMDSTIGPDDPVFRSHVGDESALLADVFQSGNEHVPAEVVELPRSLLTTLNLGQIDLTPIAEPAPVPPNQPEVAPKVEVEEEAEVQPPAKRSRGRPRVPRTNSNKPQPVYVSFSFRYC
jgi:hypothetical protein